MPATIETEAKRLVTVAATATAASPNEATLRHELEKALEVSCRQLGIPWTPFTLDLHVGRAGTGPRFVDVAHGALVIEYEPPRAFAGRLGAVLVHARGQAQEYAELLQREEGRALAEYVLAAWDGSHISFGRFVDGAAVWENLVPFDHNSARRLLGHLRDDGLPLVHPALLSGLVGPESDVGVALIPVLFDSVRQAEERATREGKARKTTKTYLLYAEWRRLFGQVVGVQSERLQQLLKRQGDAHNKLYADDPVAYLFALNTYIALVAKVVAALSLPNGSQDLLDQAVKVRDRMAALENGALFQDAGVSNMLVGDFFSWYLDEPAWRAVEPGVASLLVHLAGVSFDVRRKDPDSTRDLFKGMYETFVPPALRHALGEYYTPDWLAAHALDQLGWQVGNALLDPTCGSGTFLLEAIRRRLNGGVNGKKAKDLLAGIRGLDLNPLAVLTARASMVVFLSPYLDPSTPVHLPVYLADAINTAGADGDDYRHTLQTEVGTFTFKVPATIVTATYFYPLFLRLRELVDDELAVDPIWNAVSREFPLGALDASRQSTFRATIATLVELHANGWNGIWAAILADRLAAGAAGKVAFVAGNPPWVKWSHLPREYAEFIKPRCLELGVFSQDRWVGGIESDISTVITYEVIEKWLAAGGKMAFFITGTVFANESSQGFRRFELPEREIKCRVIRVEDFDDVSPFDGVANHPTLLLLEQGKAMAYPTTYRMWQSPRVEGAPKRWFASAAEFRREAKYTDLLAKPVPGTDAGPWLKGMKEDHEIWQHVFGATIPAYKARKGITTDLNGVFFVEVLSADHASCSVRNDPSLGRKDGIARVTAPVEREHVFPLLRGRGVSAFRAEPDPVYRVLLPQRGMHGDPDLPQTAPKTFRFLKRFKELLEMRSSLRRFQRGQVYWSIWSTGTYTFSPYKVLWKEMAGGRFAAAYIGSFADPVLGERNVIPDHKLYFVPVETENEAAYLTGLLNAPTVARAIAGYASQLSLGASVVEYLDIPAWDTASKTHRALAALSKRITRRATAPTATELATLDKHAATIIGFHVNEQNG